MDEREDPSPENGEQILDLLLDALLARQAARDAADKAEPMAKEGTAAVAADQRVSEAAPIEPYVAKLADDALSPPVDFEPIADDWLEEAPVSPAGTSPPFQLERFLGRLSLAILGLILIINIPFNRFGTTLATAMPDSAALVIRDGLLLKGSGPEVYVLENNQKRWITTIDAFEWFGYEWDNVHEVEDAFLERFGDGLPVHLLLKCEPSPHVFALEAGEKRWSKDIPTFEAQGYLWQDIRTVSCAMLRQMPDGPPIPEDAGEPPVP